MRRHGVLALAAIGLVVGGVGVMAHARAATAQSTDRFTLFEMFGRVN